MQLSPCPCPRRTSGWVWPEPRVPQLMHRHVTTVPPKHGLGGGGRPVISVCWGGVGFLVCSYHTVKLARTS